MGLESYFIHLLPEGVMPFKIKGEDGSTSNAFKGKSPTKTSSIIDKIEASLASKHVPSEFDLHEHKLIVDGAIEVMISEEDDFFQEATLIGCFAWYDEGLSCCYQIAREINNCVNIRVYHPLTGFMPLAEEENFKQTIRGIHQSQYEAFLRTFGDIRGKVLPHKDFYDFYRDSKNPLKRVLRSLKTIWKR